jgi:hypothetical protein
MLMATIMVKVETTIQPTDMTPGPPVISPVSKRVVIPVMTDWKIILAPVPWSGERKTNNNRERNAKIVQQSPIASQFLLITQTGQDALIRLLDCIGSSAGL